MATTDPPLAAQFVALYPRLLARIRARLPVPSDAEDLLQDLYLRLHRLPRDAAPVTEPRAYLTRAADHIAIDHLRAAARRPAQETPGEDLPLARPSVDRQIDGRRRLQRLEDSLRALPPRQREAILLARIEGLSHAEIATRMGITRSAVEKLMIKALARCRRDLADFEGSP